MKVGLLGGEGAGAEALPVEEDFDLELVDGAVGVLLAGVELEDILIAVGDGEGVGEAASLAAGVEGLVLALPVADGTEVFYFLFFCGFELFCRFLVKLFVGGVWEGV